MMHTYINMDIIYNKIVYIDMISVYRKKLSKIVIGNSHNLVILNIESLPMYRSEVSVGMFNN